MKRAWPILVLLTTLLWADGVYQFDFTGTGTGSAINNVRAQNAYQKITWTITGGTLSGCQVQLDSSADASSWSAGGAITSQACTSNGASAIVNTTPNFMRINVTTFTVATGTPVLHVIWRGYVNNPAGGGTPGGSNTQIQYNNSGAFGGAANTSLDSSGNATLNSLTVGPGTPNDGTTGVTIGLSAMINSSGNLIKCTTAQASDLSCKPVVAVVLNGVMDTTLGHSYTTGNGYIQDTGTVTVTFDGATTYGDCVVLSGTVDGKYHDGGSACSALSSLSPRGVVKSTNGAGGDYLIELIQGYNAVSSGGSSPTSTFFLSQQVDRTVGVTGPIQNTAQLWPIYIPNNFKVSNLFFRVIAADNSAHTYDLGLYKCTDGNGGYSGGATSGTLLAHTGDTPGTTIAPSAGADEHFAVLGAPVSGTAGWYVVALGTGSASPTMTLGGAIIPMLQPFSYVATGQVLITYSGGLPSTITCPAASWTVTNALWIGIYQ